MTERISLAEITAWDAAIQTTRILRYASGNGYVTGGVLPSIIVARKSTLNGGAPEATARLQGLGYYVVENLTATLDECRPYGIVVVDMSAWGSAADAAIWTFAQQLLADGQQVLITGNDADTTAFFCATSAAAGTVGVTQKFLEHPIWTGVTTLTNDGDGGNHFRTLQTGGLLTSVRGLGKYDVDAAGFSVVEGIHGSGGRMLFVPRFTMTGNDTDLFWKNCVAFLANLNLVYERRIDQPALLRRDAFDTRTTFGESRVAYGELVLLNGDGALDILNTYGVDGRPITIWQGPPTGAYPRDFTKVLVGTMQSCLVDTMKVTIKLRDRQAETQIPLQATKYLGNNIPPNGLEGLISDLKGKPKPICYGMVKNAPARLVNPQKFIFQMADLALASIDGVYDRGVALGAKFDIIVGGGPNVALTTDATTYTNQTSHCPSNGLNGVAVGNGILVGVGNNGAIITSWDGTNWTDRTGGTPFGTSGSDTVNAVAFGNGWFIACGNNGKIARSRDGISWALIPASPFTSTLNGIFYVNGVWLIAGIDNSANGLLGTSSNDGTGWTVQANPFGVNQVRGVTYGLGLFVMVGDAGNLATSPDAQAWTSRTSSFGASNIFGVAFNGTNLFVAAGGVNKAASSPDAINWTQHAPGFGVNASVSICYDPTNSLWILGGQGGQLATSPDGGTTAWVLRTSTFGAFAVQAIVHCEGMQDASYANQTDLLDDTKAPAASRWKAYPAGGYFRVGTSPAGLVTADATEGTTAADRTAAQIWKRILTARGGKSSGDYKAADLTTLDAAFPAVCGRWFPDETQVEAALTEVATTAGAWWGVDRLGLFRLQQLLAPNLIENGDFEADIGGTAVRGGATLVRSTAQSYLGAASLKITTSNVDDSGVTISMRSGAKLPVAPNQQYGCSLQYYGSGAAIGTQWLQVIEWWDASNVLISVSVAPAIVLAAGWHQSLRTVMSPSGAAQAVVTFRTSGAQGVVDVWVDALWLATTSLSFLSSDVQGLARVPSNDQAAGLPAYQSIVQYGRVFAVQTSDLAALATLDRRNLVAQEWRQAKATDLTVQAAHPLAPQIVETSLLTAESDAITEVARRQTLRGIMRDLLQFTVADDYPALAPPGWPTSWIAHQGVASGAGFSYRVFATLNYLIVAGDELHYDVFIDPGNAQFKYAVDLQESGGTNLRDLATTIRPNDQNGVAQHPSTDLSAWAKGQWYHRQFKLDVWAGKTIAKWMSAHDVGAAGTYFGRLANVVIKNNGVIKAIAYMAGTVASISTHAESAFTVVSVVNAGLSPADLGSVISLTAPRLGLSGGKPYRVLAVAPNAAQRQIALTVWGGI